MEKTNKKTLEEIIRVDHAGERGAIKIYEGQLLALKTFKQDEFLKKKIEEMKEHEKEHYEYFDNEIKKRNIKPYKTFTSLGSDGCNSWFWNGNVRRKSSHALYCIS
mgnify:CR=1 FL=1